MVQIGDKIRITSDNENYNRYRGKAWVVSHIARNRDEHPGYDTGVGGALIDCKGLPFSLYEYEFDIISTNIPRRRKLKGWHEKPDASGKAPRHKAASTRKKLSGTMLFFYPK